MAQAALARPALRRAKGNHEYYCHGLMLILTRHELADPTDPTQPAFALFSLLAEVYRRTRSTLFSFLHPTSWL